MTLNACDGGGLSLTIHDIHGPELSHLVEQLPRGSLKKMSLKMTTDLTVQLKTGGICSQANENLAELRALINVIHICLIPIELGHKT